MLLCSAAVKNTSEMQITELRRLMKFTLAKQ